MNGRNVYALARIPGPTNPKMTIDSYPYFPAEFPAEERAITNGPAYARNGHQMDPTPVAASPREP
jgi:hypothetical protein